MIRESVITSGVGQVIYNMIKDGSVGNIHVSAVEHSKVKLLPSGSTANSLSWNIRSDSLDKSSIIITSKVGQIPKEPKSPGNYQLIPQPKPFWILSSKIDYGEGSFKVNASETISNSLIDSVGLYSFDGLDDWYVNLSNNFVFFLYISKYLDLQNIFIGAFLLLNRWCHCLMEKYCQPTFLVRFNVIYRRIAIKG